MTAGFSGVPCEVCGGSGNLFRYWGEGDYLEDICDGCDGSGQVVPLDGKEPVEGGPLTPSALRAVASWLDTYDRMAELFFDILARSGRSVPEEIDQTITGKGIQNDLRRWADELEQSGSYDAGGESK